MRRVAGVSIHALVRARLVGLLIFIERELVSIHALVRARPLAQEYRRLLDHVSIHALVRARLPKNKCLFEIGKYCQECECRPAGTVGGGRSRLEMADPYKINELRFREPVEDLPVAKGSRQKTKGPFKSRVGLAPTCSTRFSHFAPSW